MAALQPSLFINVPVPGNPIKKEYFEIMPVDNGYMVGDMHTRDGGIIFSAFSGLYDSMIDDSFRVVVDGPPVEGAKIILTVDTVTDGFVSTVELFGGEIPFASFKSPSKQGVELTL